MSAAGPVWVLTRSAADNARLACLLRGQFGAALGRVRSLPCIRTETVAWHPSHAALDPPAAGGPPPLRAVAFTARPAAGALVALLRRRGLALPAQAPLFAVGPATAAAVTEHLGRPPEVPGQHRADALLQLLVQRLGPAQAGAVLLPRSSLGRATLAEGLAVRGHAVADVVVYATLPALADPAPVTWDPCLHYIVCASPSGVEGFFRRAQPPPQARYLALGPTTAQALTGHGVPVFARAQAHNLQGLLALVADLLSPRAKDAQEFW